MAAHLFPILIDDRPDWLRDNGPPSSLLLLPCASGSLAQLLREQMIPGNETLRVLPTFESWPGYEQQLAASLGCPVQAVTPRALQAFFAQAEPSDWVLVVDPRHVPLESLELTHLLPDGRHGCWHAKQLVVLDRTDGATRECAVLDAGGCIERVQRYFDGTTHLQLRGVACCLMPVTAARRLPLRRFTSAAEVRAAVAQLGVPSNDVAMACPVVTLADQYGVLALNEHLLLTAGARSDADNTRILRGAGVVVHPKARLSGPVVLQDNVVVEREAHIIGPAVIGRDAVVGHNSVVAQCVVTAGVNLRPESIVSQRLVCGAQPTRDCAYSPEVATAQLSIRIAPEGSDHERPASDRGIYPYVKRAVDFCVALVALIVLSPLMALTALVIKLSSPGPVLFAHAREGRGGKVFRCLKFRTMVADADLKQREMYSLNQVDGPQFKLSRDPRVTRVGHWLRATNIDELPQFINVLLGDMSLVGPRPSPFRENQICVSWRKARLSVRPGITGLWQVCRHARQAADFHQWIHYDTLYVRHFSAWLDIKIVLATVLSLAGRWPVPLEWLIPPRRLRRWENPRLGDIRPTRQPAGGDQPCTVI